MPPKANPADDGGGGACGNDRFARAIDRKDTPKKLEDQAPRLSEYRLDRHLVVVAVAYVEAEAEARRRGLIGGAE